MAHSRFISAIMCTLISVNTLTLVFAGLMAWLGYAIPARLRQLGFAPELVIAMGFGSLLIACIGLCGLNYSSSQMLYFYAFSCLTFVLLLVIGLPEFVYKPAGVGSRLAKAVNSSSAAGNILKVKGGGQVASLNGTSALAATIAAEVPQISDAPSQATFLFRDIMYFSLISLLLLLIVISIIFGQHLSLKFSQSMLHNNLNSRRPLLRANLNGNANYRQVCNNQHQQQQYCYNQEQSTSCEVIPASGEYIINQRRNSLVQRRFPSLSFQQAAQLGAAVARHDSLAQFQCVVGRSKSLANERLISAQCSCALNQQHQPVGKNLNSHLDEENAQSLIAGSFQDLNSQSMLRARITRSNHSSPTKYLNKLANQQQLVTSNEDEPNSMQEDNELALASTEDDCSGSINMLNGPSTTSGDFKQQEYSHSRRVSRHSAITTASNVPRHSMATTNTSSCFSCNNHNNNICDSYKSLIMHSNTPRASVSAHYGTRRISEVHKGARSSQEFLHRASNNQLKPSATIINSSNKSLAISEHFLDLENAQLRYNNNNNNNNNQARSNLNVLRCTCIAEQEAADSPLAPLHLSGVYHYDSSAPNDDAYLAQQIKRTSNNTYNSFQNIDLMRDAQTRGGLKTTPSSPSLTTNCYQFQQQNPYKTTYAIGSTSSRLKPRPHSANNKLIVNPNQTINFNRKVNLTSGPAIKRKKRSGASSVMAMTAAAAAALFGGVVDTGHVDDASFDEYHQMPADLDQEAFPMDSATAPDCQCAPDLSGATNHHNHHHHHLEVPLRGIDSQHTVGWNGPREPLLDFGPLMSHQQQHNANAMGKQ